MMANSEEGLDLWEIKPAPGSLSTDLGNANVLEQTDFRLLLNMIAPDIFIVLDFVSFSFTDYLTKK